MPEAGLPVHGSGWRLDHRCLAIGGPAQAVGCYAPSSAGPSVVYGRYEVIAGTTVLQYWIFYEHNFWSHPALPFGAAWQAHEGDWEVVHVVLDDKRTPVEVGYSQHCTGERRAWDDVTKASGTEHPIVFVARGSHANYFTPGVHPFAPACVPPQARPLNPVDVNVPGMSLGPGSTAIELVHDQNPRWLRFPGTWGRRSTSRHRRSACRRPRSARLRSGPPSRTTGSTRSARSPAIRWGEGEETMRRRRTTIAGVALAATVAVAAAAADQGASTSASAAQAWSPPTSVGATSGTRSRFSLTGGSWWAETRPPGRRSATSR